MSHTMVHVTHFTTTGMCHTPQSRVTQWFMSHTTVKCHTPVICHTPRHLCTHHSHVAHCGSYHTAHQLSYVSHTVVCVTHLITSHTVLHATHRTNSDTHHTPQTCVTHFSNESHCGSCHTPHHHWYVSHTTVMCNTL